MQEIKNRWTIHRIGLINFWYYDEQEFIFSNGKLLLRGSNGSGKSVTMQSFIPLLFDGNKSPERLDPFGSRARKLENYLLGEDDNLKTENTGYLYMEFIKPETGNYLTIGMGLRAKRGRPIEFWGFSINDGRRIGSDIQLYKNIGEKIPLSKIELRNRIGDNGGEVLEGQREYMEMVNKLLYGFEDIEEYEQLIKLLVQIRTPKLSKEFRPSVIYEIMNNSLQPLSDDDLRPLSEAIENMDKIKDQLELLKLSQRAAEKLKTEYNRYNKYVLFEKAQEFLNATDKLDASVKEETELQKQSEDFQRFHLRAE
ncbi:MAG: TIGR02680 family protein, partial [Ruminiclostridium sp.]